MSTKGRAKRQFHRKSQSKIDRETAERNAVVQTTGACYIAAAMRLLQAEPHNWSHDEALEFGLQLGPLATAVAEEFVQAARARASGTTSSGGDGPTADTSGLPQTAVYSPQVGDPVEPPTFTDIQGDTAALGA